MTSVSPYEKMRLERARRQEKAGPGRTPDPAPVRAVKKKVPWQALKRAGRVLAERHSDEYNELKKQESDYLRSLIEELYAEGFTEVDALTAEFYRRVN